MGSAPGTARHVRATLVATIMLITLAAAGMAAPARSHAAELTVAEAAQRLADDTDEFAAASSELRGVRADLRRSTQRHERMGIDIERRLVAIYKAGGSMDTIARAAAVKSVRDVGTSLDALDVLARDEARMLETWRALGRRCDKLRTRRASLTKRVERSRAAVRAGRIRLSKAEAAAAKAREEARRMAEVRDSPLLPRVGHPETVVTRATTGGDTEATSVQEQPVGFSQSGVASMYADSFDGQRTANGEHYDPAAFTAAHPSLPFGSWVTVTGPAGSIAVRINDRGPFVGGRVIDLSRAAAHAVGIMGIANVTLRVQA